MTKTPSQPTGPRRSTKRVALFLNTDGGANQADGPSTDINSIMAQYRKSGTLPNVARKNPLYGDFTFGDDLHEIREAMFNAEDRFMDLPSSVRAAADNDWVKFISMFDNPEQQEILKNAGLKIAPPNNIGVITTQQTTEKDDSNKSSDETTKTETPDGRTKS